MSANSEDSRLTWTCIWSVFSTVAVLVLLVLPEGNCRTQVLSKDIVYIHSHTEKKSQMQVGIADIFVSKANSMREMIK